MSDDQKTELETQQEAATKKAEEANAARSGKGTRAKVGLTRGRNPLVITFEQFDESKPETLPVSLQEFMELTKISDEKSVVEFLIDGYNSAQYTLASDPVAEYVDPTWNDDVKKQFRIVVRNYASMTGVSIEDAAALVKPGIAKAAAATK